MMEVRIHSLLADGSRMTITATRRPRSGRADVKCGAAGDVQLAAHMQQVVRLARHTEAQLDSRDQVVISLDRLPGRAERDWELAVVLADRLVRGVWQHPGELVANGWSERWHLGRIDGHDVQGAPAGVLLGGELAYLGALTGQPDAAASVGSARAWFPLHSGGINDTLCWVEVSVFPADGDDEIIAPALDAAGQLDVRQTLAGARHFDGCAPDRWRTVVRFGQPRFQGESYQFALVMADRIARGREFIPRGRVIASGASSAWHAGRVEAVEGCAPKCALILRQAQAGDRVLLPRAWEGLTPPGFAQALKDQGASLALVERIGLL